MSIDNCKDCGQRHDTDNIPGTPESNHEVCDVCNVVVCNLPGQCFVRIDHQLDPEKDERLCHDCYADKYDSYHHNRG